MEGAGTPVDTVHLLRRLKDEWSESGDAAKDQKAAKNA